MPNTFALLRLSSELYAHLETAVDSLEPHDRPLYLADVEQTVKIFKRKYSPSADKPSPKPPAER